MRCPKGVTCSTAAAHGILSLDGGRSASGVAIRACARCPRERIETAGRPALVIGYESVMSNERLEIVADRATYQTLRVYGEASR